MTHTHAHAHTHTWLQQIYSRNAENNTTKYPDIAALVKEVVGPTTTSIVFDAEAVAYDRETDKILPFQVAGVKAL